ncbi:hypothetical protein QBC35DRAFT_492064 [Podospora australis]|uniref:Uncharacterized protein n=1 Tax=Podospora australis TaxID=1536484 RepID=A0AAN6WX84_9PEZI|nr:hypothetical protein QBC35DRAFT_492064 [Podospora australis]
MHGSSCPKCGAASDGSSKACGACGAVCLPPFYPPFSIPFPSSSSFSVYIYLRLVL